MSPKFPIVNNASFPFVLGNDGDRRTFNMPGGIGLASSLSERESDLEAPVAPGLRRIGLLA